MECMDVFMDTIPHAMAFCGVRCRIARGIDRIDFVISV